MQFSMGHHIILLCFTLMRCLQGIPGDEGPCGEPGMTGDPVSEKIIKYRVNIKLYGDIIGSSRS